MHRLLILIGITMGLSTCIHQNNNMETLELMKKEIKLSACHVLFDKEITAESLAQNWTVHHSEWWLEDGWLHGKNPGNHPGMVVLNQDFPLGTVALSVQFFVAGVVKG